MQADLHIRGGGFDQALVLLNGVRLSDPQTGHHLLNLPVDWSAVERIEVLKGPAARVFGQNAFAGAVNLVTQAPAQRQLRAGVGAGDFGLLNAELYAALPVGRLRQHVAASGAQSDGYRYNTDFKTWNVFYQAHLADRDGRGTWGLLADFNQRQFGANGFYGRLEFRDQYEALQTNLVALDYRRQVGNWTLKPRAYWRRNQDWYVFTRNNPPAFQNFHLSQVAGVELNASWHHRLGQTGLGLNPEFTALHSSRLGQRERTVVQVFAEHRMLFFNQKLDVTPGISLSHYSDFGWFAYPGLEAGYRLSPQWKVYANTGYTNRVPTFTDLYYVDAGSQGNPNLQPERALSSELGGRFSRRAFSLQVAVFQRVGNNLIDWAKDNDADKWQTRNFNQITTNGAEAHAEWAHPSLTSGARPWLRRWSLGYTWLDANVDDQVAFSRYALNHLRHQATALVEVKVWGPVTASLRGRYCDRVTNTPGVRGDYWVLDGKLAATVGRWTAFVDAQNLTNEVYGELRYSDTAVLTMPGRWARAGLQWHF
jgi:iron complex outermembrane receptor protein